LRRPVSAEHFYSIFAFFEMPAYPGGICKKEIQMTGLAILVLCAIGVTGGTWAGSFLARKSGFEKRPGQPWDSSLWP
jgi:hypothetical protein